MPQKPEMTKGTDVGGGCMGANDKPTVSLHPTQSAVAQIPAKTYKRAVGLAYRYTTSQHEHTWTDEEAADMAWFVLWAHQRLSGIKQLVDGALDHSGEGL